MRRRFLLILLVMIALASSVTGPMLAQAPTVANGQVLLNGTVILDPQAEAPGCPDLFRLMYTPDHQWFVVVLQCAQTDNEAFVFRADGSLKRRLTGAFDFVRADRILWSPDSHSLLYERANDLLGAPQQGEPENGVVRYDVQTGDKRLLLARVSFNAAAWSPDSRFVAYTVVYPAADTTHLYLLRADGSGLWELESVGTDDTKAILSWEPDSAGQVALTYVSPKVSTEVDTQVSEQPAASLGQGWQTVAPLSPYYVTGVANDDILNMRAGAGVNNGIVYTIPPYGSGVFFTGQAQDVGISHWAEVTFAGTTGWVNRKFLLPQLAADAAQPISVRTIATG